MAYTIYLWPIPAERRPEAYIVIAYIDMADTFLALYNSGLYSYGPI